MKKRNILLACLGVCALVLATRKKEKPDAAPVDPLGEAHAPCEVPEGKEGEAQTEPETVAVAEAEEELLCYFTEKGGKWHARESCQYLKNSKEIFSGSYASAVAAGKVTPCSACAAAYIEE